MLLNCIFFNSKFKQVNTDSTQTKHLKQLNKRIINLNQQYKTRYL